MMGRSCWFLILLLSPGALGYLCHSCFKSCESADPNSCDCESSVTDNSCTSDFCFVRIDLFIHDDVSSIQKGCSDDMPGGMDGCYYSGRQDSILCNCKGELCNSRNFLSNYRPIELPKVRCCDCPDPFAGCPLDRCEEACTGNYCYFEIESESQGCGHGFPRVYGLVRAEEYQTMEDSTTSCALTQAGPKRMTHGCVCQGDYCNIAEKVTRFDEQWLRSLRKSSDWDTPKEHLASQQCYALTITSKSPLNESVYRDANACTDHFCYVTFYSSSVVLESTGYLYDDGEKTESAEEGDVKPSREEQYELEAGCLKVNKPESVSLGCSSEWSSDPDRPLSKHCICSGHMCNYFNQISSREGLLIAPAARPRRPPNSASSVDLKTMVFVFTLCFGVFVFMSM